MTGIPEEVRPIYSMTQYWTIARLSAARVFAMARFASMR
jgi:hypothetical protein